MTKSMPLEAALFSGLRSTGLHGVGLADEGLMWDKREQIMTDANLEIP